MRPQHSLPYVYFSLLPPGDAIRAITGVGQISTFEVVGGLQTFPKDVATSIATNLAAMIWVPTSEPGEPPGQYTAYSPSSYERDFGTPPPIEVGYPPSATGAYVLVAPASISPVDALTAGRPLERAMVVIAANIGAALLFATPGDTYGVVVPKTTGTTSTEKKGMSTAVVVAGLAAAAVAALFIFA